MTAPQRLRYAVIGVGANVYTMHHPALRHETVEVVGVTDRDEAASRQRAEELGCPSFPDYRAMLRATRPDVAVILTPHPLHAPMAVECLRAGCHVLVEKPMAVHVAEADAMIRAAAQAGRVLAVNFQQRLRPEVVKAAEVVRSGRLGRVQHLDLAVTWPRTAAYYRLAAWRATWRGEGGGVLLNQAPHDLDLICHLLGPPERVVAWTRTQLHTIETEDTVQAMLEWPDGAVGNGAMGSVRISTAEAGRPARLELLGTGGYLRIGAGELSFGRFGEDVTDFFAQNPDPFAAPTLQSEPLALPPGGGDHTGDHKAVYRNLHDAITQGVPVAADGTEGRMSLELANAMILSSFTRSAVELPLDRERYAALLARLKGEGAAVAGLETDLEP